MKLPSGSFDLVYTRMLLQYIPDKETAVAEMVRVCKPGGVVLIQDLDGQLVWHYPEETLMQETIHRVMKSLAETGFDPFVGRKLFWMSRNAGLENLQTQVECYHLIAGEIDPGIFEQWELKLEIARPHLERALGSEYEADEEIRIENLRIKMKKKQLQARVLKARNSRLGQLKGAGKGLLRQLSKF